MLLSLLLSRICWFISWAKTLFDIYFYKQGPSLIATNIFLRNNSDNTFLFSICWRALSSFSTTSVLVERNIIWSFLNTDYYYLNNQAMLDSRQIHNHSEVQYLSIGNNQKNNVLLPNFECSLLFWKNCAL